MSQEGHALSKQLAQAAAQLGTAGAGDISALADLIKEAVAAVTAASGGCQLSLKDRLACCQLLEQLLQTPVGAGHVAALQQQPTNPTAPSTQALFRQMLGQLPGLTLQEQLQQQPTQPASSSSSCLVLQLVHQQEPGACLHLPALLQSAAEQLQAASAQEPGAAKWHERQAWQLGQQLLQLAATTAQQAVQQQLVLAGSAEVHLQLYLRLVDGLRAALAAAEGTGGAAVAAVMSAAELVYQLLVAVQQLGLLDSQGCHAVHRALLQLVLPPVNGCAWPDLSCPDAALQPPVAGTTAAAPALEQCHPQRLQVLCLLLRQEDGASSWADLAGLLADDPASGWDVLLQLVLSVLQAVAALQATAATAAAAAAEAAARQAARQESGHDTDSEQDYFQDIFGSDGADDDGSRTAAAAGADSSKPAATPEQAVCELATELLTGLAAHMQSTAAAGSSSSWGTREQRMLQLGMCCVALDLPRSKQQDEEQQQQQQGGLHSLTGVQQAVQDAVMRWCGSSTAAGEQLQQVVLLTAPVAGHARSPALLHVAAQVVMQHAAAAAAGGAEACEALLLTPWVHLATQLACVTEAAADSCSSTSAAQLQQQLAWLLCPSRLSLIQAAALAAPAAERALLAAVMLHALERCSAALEAVTLRTAAPARGGAEQDAAEAAGDAGSATGLVGPPALALCALHACLSVLLWLLLPPALLPTGWLQQHLQGMLQAPAGGDTTDSTPAADLDGSSGAAVQLRHEPWPVGLAWVAALLQYKHDTDELPTLLESLGVLVDGAAQEALAGLLPGFVPSCLPGMAAAGNTAALQDAAQQMQEPSVRAAALALLQDQHSSSGASWHSVGAGSCSSVLTQLLDSVLPVTSATWTSDAGCSGSNVAAAVAHSCCQERALQLLLALQDEQKQDSPPAAAGGFNMFGSYQHLVQLQQQLEQLLAECATLVQDNSSSSSSDSQLVPCRLSLAASSLTLHQLAPPLEQPPAVAAVAARLAGVLAGSLSDALQRFRLYDSDVSTPRLLRQQLQTCCAEIELLGHTMQAACVLLLPHLAELLPLLSQLQAQVAHMQLRCLCAALSTCYSLPGSSRGQQVQWLQVLLTLCTDVDYAADAVDAVHEGLGYCLLASLSADTHGPCWPSTAEPSEAVAAVATATAALTGASAAEASAARSVAQLLAPGGEPFASQPGQDATDWLLVTQELDLLHSCLAPVPLPHFWPVSSLNRASGVIAAAGACLAASAASMAAGETGRQQPAEQEQPQQEAPAAAAVPAAAAAAIAEWMLSMEQLELQLPLLLRPLQLQHAHLLEAAAGLASSHLQDGTSMSTSAPAAAAAAARWEPKGVEAVLVNVSAALGAAVREAAAVGEGGDTSAASALAAAAVSRLRDAAEGADGYGACASLQDSSTAAQVVQCLVQSRQQEQQQQAVEQHDGASVLQQLWHCVAIGLVQTSRIVDLVQQVSGALHGSDDPQAQQLHDSFLQVLRASLLQLPQQHFDQLLLQQLSTRDAFASNGSGVCRELWQMLLGAEEPGSGNSAVQLLQRLLAALLQLTFSTKPASGASGAATEGCSGISSSGMGRKQLSAVSSLLGVVMTCATGLGLPGVLACCTSLKGLAAASSEWADADASGSRTEAGQQSGCAEAAGVTVTERLVPFLPLLLFVQRVVSQASTTGRASSRSRAVRKSDSAVSRSSRESVGFSAGPHSQSSEAGEQQGGSRRSSSAGDAQEASAAQAQQERVDSEASTVSGGPFEAAASSLVLQDDAVQVLGGAAAAAHFEEEDDFLDEFEDEEEYLAQLLHNGALAAAAGAGAGSGDNAQQPGGGTGGAGGPGAAAAAVPQAGGRDGDGDGDATSDEDASSSDSDESGQEEADNSHSGAAAQPAGAAPGGSTAAAAATGPAGGAAAAAAAAAAGAAAAAAGAAFVAAGEGVDEDERALLDEEFAALLQELLAAGAAPDVALAAVTAATGMAPPAAAVAVASEAAAASGDDEMVAVVEQLAAGAAAAAADAAAGGAGDGAASTAATSHTTSPVAARQAGASAGHEQGTGTAAAAGAGGGSRSSRRSRHRPGDSDSGSSYLPQLRRYWRRTHAQQQAEPEVGAGSTPSGPEHLHCTFAVHGDQFVEQHWFQCYTCGLTDSRGCCSACVRICHAGHDVVYAAKSRFFCDCGGENGPRGNAVACKCLTAVPVSPLAPAQSSSAAGGSCSSSSLVQQGWLVPAPVDPLARVGLAASLPDPLDAAWAFDPQLYPDAYAAATGSNGSSSTKSASSKQQASAELLLQCVAAPRAQEQQAAAAKLVPQGLVAKAARALAAGSDTREVLQDVAGSALQLSHLLLSLLRCSKLAALSSEVRPVLPAVLQTKALVMESSSSSTKVLTRASTGSTDKAAAAASDAGSSGGGSSGSSGSAHQQQQQPLVDLQRVIRLGTMSSSSSSRTRTRTSSDYGADGSSSGGSRGAEVPPEVTAALEGGMVCQQSAAAARQGQLLAVCRGESVGLMDGRLLAAELCGRDIFTKEEISAAVALTSKALSPGQAPGSSSSAPGNDAGGAGSSSSGAASSYFYVRRHAAKFHVLALHWDLLQGRRLLVVGYDQVQVWSIQQRDLTIADRLPLQLPLPAAGGGDEAGRVVSAAAWLPDSDTWVAVSTPLRVFLFDLTHSASQPAVVVEPQGHVLLSGGAAFVPRLVQQQEREGQQPEQQAVVTQPLQQQLYVLLLTRDGQLLSAELPPRLLDRQQSCATHWPHVSCLAATTSSSAASPGLSAAAAADRSARPSSSGEGSNRDASGGSAPTSSSSGYGCPRLVAQAVAWPSATSSPQLQTGRSCHWLQAYSLLAVAGTWQPPAAAAAAAAGDSADSSSSSAEAEQQQLLLQLDDTCSSVLQCCRWDTAAAAAPILGSPKPLVLSPASVYWDLPLLPAARASYGAAQLFAVAPGQARKLLNGTGSSTSSGQGCAYIAGLMSTAGTASAASSDSGSSGAWQAVVQPLHLRHSSAGAVVDGLAVLSFPYSQQLLLVVLCSKGNMYMYATRRPPGLTPMQPFTQLLRTQLTAGPQQQQQSGTDSTSGAAGEGSRSSTSAAAAAAGDAQQGVSRRAAAVALATGVLPDAAQGAAASDGTSQQQQQQSGSIVPAAASILLLQHCQNLSSHLSVSGDISRAGSAEAAARALFKTPTDPERRLEGPTPGAGMSIVIKVAPACALQPVGLKLLLPGGGAAPTSVKLTFGDGSSSSAARSGGGASGSSGGGGGRPNSIAAIAAAARTAARAAAGASSGTGSSNTRTVQVAAPRDSGSSSSSSGRYQRWHQVIFTPEESAAAAAAAGQVALEFGPPVDPERRVAVCHLDLFGQPGEVVAQRAKQQAREQEEEQVLSMDTCCTAAGAAVPAVLMSAGCCADTGSIAATASLQLLLNAVLQTGAAAATAAAAAGQATPAVPAASSKSQWKQQVLAVVKQLLCPDAQAAAVWSPSWQCEAAAHALAATAADESPAAPADTAAEGAGDAAAGSAAAASATALAVQDGWKLSQAATVLRQFGTTAMPAAAAAEDVLDDAAVFAFLHAMAQLQSVLQVRPAAVVDYLRQHSSSSGEGLAACASSGLVAAVFALKQLSSATLLPCELLTPLAKTAVELWVAEAAACQQQQQEGQDAAVQHATGQAAQGLLGLLLSSDLQVRLHSAAAWVQAVSSSSSSSMCAVFAAVAGLLLAQQQVPCSQLLPAYQAVADIARHLLRSAATAAAAGWPEGSGASAQAVAQVVRVLVQQLSALHQQQSGGSLSASTAEQSMLLQLLLARILSAAWEQQQQQQQASSSDGTVSSSTSGGAAASASQQQQKQLHRQLLPPALLQQLAGSLLATLQSLVPLLQQQQQSGAGGVHSVLPGEGAQQVGPGGYSNYQALLSPPPAVSTWGVSRSCCQSLLGAPPAAAAAATAVSSSSSSNAGEAWLLDPYLQGGQSATRLLQGLPLQLAAASVDLAHSVLQYGLVGTAGGRVDPAQLLPALSSSHSSSSSSSQPGTAPVSAAADATAACGTAALWCGVLCQVMDLPALHPVRRLAKQVVLDMCGSSLLYREVRSLHLLSKHTAALFVTLGLPEQQQQQQQEVEEQEKEGREAGVRDAAAAAVGDLQASWQQQCAVAACLAQLLSVAESQPVTWAHVCSSSSSSRGVVLLLMQLALACKVPQLSLTAVKLVNAALLGAVKAASSSSKTRQGSSKGGKDSSSAADAATQQQSSSSSSSSKASAARVPILDLSWLLPQQQQQQQQPSLLSVFMDHCVVGWPEVKERLEAAKTLVLLHKTIGAAASGDSSGPSQQQGLLLHAVLQAVPSAGPLAGAGSLQLFSAANQLLKLTSQTAAGADTTPPPTAAAAGAGQGWSQAVSTTAGELFATAAAAASALAVHPCGLAYQQLQELLEFQQPGSSSSSSMTVGFWLELCGCDVAGGRLARKPPNTAVRLDSIAAELKFGDKQVMARLAGWYSVHKLLLVVHSPRRSKAVASLRLWYCDSPISDLQQLKQQGPPSLPATAAAPADGSNVGSRQPAWKLAAAEVPLSPGQTEVTVSFELPLLLSCLMVEFAGFHVSVNESSAEVLHCPRCSHVVTDKHGLCSYCRENAYQCRQCRHINYEAPDAFICSECGHSRYGRFELLLQAVKGPACPPLLAQANLDEALSALDTAAAAAASKASALQAASTAVQQQAAALATAGFHHTPIVPAAASGSGGNGSKRGSSGGASSSSAESLMRPGLRHLAELYTERCKPAFDEALQAARAHAAVRSAIAEADAATGSSSSSSSGNSSTDSSMLAVSNTRAPVAAAATDADAAAALFSSCSYGHTSAVLSASINLLRGALAAAPAAVTAAAQQQHVLPGLLALLDGHGSMHSLSSVGVRAAASGSSSSSSSLVSDVRSLLLGLCRADPSLHDQLLTLLQQQLLAASPAAADSSSKKPSGGVTFGGAALSGHQLQLLLMVAQHDVQHLPKDPTAAAAAGQQGAAAPKLVLQLLQLAVTGGFTEGLWPELLLLPGLKVMAGTAAVQQQLAKAAAAQAARDAADAAAAASAAAHAEAAAAEAAAAAADTAVELLGATPPGSPPVTPPAATTTAAEEGLDVLDATVLSDAEAERLEQRKIAEYLSKKGPGSSAQLPSRAAPGFLQQQQRQQQRQRLQPLGYGQSPLVAQQQLPVLRSARPGGGKAPAAVDAEAEKARQQQQQRQQEQQEAARKAQAASAAAAEKAAASAAAAAALPGFVPLQELLLLAQQLLRHPHNVAVRKESAALLLQLQPDPLARLQQLQEQLPAACAALAHSTPGAVSVPGTELCALLMETVAELLVLSCRGPSAAAQPDASSSGGAADSDSSRAHTQASAALSDPPQAAAKAAHVSASTARAALSGLLSAVCQQLVGQVSGLLQQEQQLWPGQQAAAAGPARTAALPMLLEQVEQLLIGLAQLQPHHHQHHQHALSPRRHMHHHQQQQEGEGAAGWVDAVCLQQLLWSVAGLDALTAGRTATSQAAAHQLHRLLKQGWLAGGAAAAAAGQAGGGRDGTYGYSDSAGEEDEEEDYTEADEYETELECEEDEGEGEEGLSEAAAGEGQEGPAGRSAGGAKLLSRLPALTTEVLAQRQAQLVEALVQVLASELARYDQQQQQQLSAHSAVAPAAAAVGSAPAAAGGASSGLSWRSSLAVCSSLVVLLCSAVSPEKPPPSYQLLLEKAATQEEFIPGQLPSGGLVTSATLAAAAAAAGGAAGGGGSGEGGAAVGPLMRDVKNYICRRLDMTGLLDDDFGMELLVGGSLISLALPVLDVLNHHWGPLYQQQQAGRGGRTAAAGAGSSSGGVSPGVPMPVTFRLSGLDGEATEPQVKELNPGQAAGQNPDEEAVLAGVLAHGQGTGLGLLLQLLLIAHQQPVRALRRVSGQLLQLLKASVGQAECRQQLLQQGALGCLLHLVHLAVKPLLAASSTSTSSRGAAGDRTASLQAPGGGALGCGITGVQLLLLLEALQELVSEANMSGQPVQLGAISAPEAAAVPSSPLQRTQQQQRRAVEAAGATGPSAAATSSSSSAPLSLSAALVSSSSTEVAQLADGLSVLEARGLGSCAAVLAKLLTALAQHSTTAQLGLTKHFAPALDLQALDEAAAAAGGADTTAEAAVVGTADNAQADADAAAAAAGQGELAAEAAAEGSGEEAEEEEPLLAAVHAEAGGAMSVHEHCLQLKAFLRLIEALSNSPAAPRSSSTTAAAAPAAAGQEQQAGGSTAAVTDFKQLVLEQGVPGRLADYLLAAFTPPQSAALDSSSSAGADALLQPGAPAWAAVAARPGVPFALQLLTALAQGHAPTAADLAAQQPLLLQLLHLLEGTAGGSTITPLAEACLEALARAGAAGVAARIADLRAATAAEMKARAARKRAALLASMGMVQVEAAAAAGGGVKIVPSPGAVPAMSPLAAELAALEGGVPDDDDEGGNVCMVCREGYGLQPTTLLGCYCFCRVAAAAEWPGCGPPWGTPHDLLLTTVSHFNLIHTQCHAAAKAADASLRQPKREWQGATLRNGNVLCNSLLPLAAPVGGKVETAYAAAVTSFWQQQLSAPSAREAAAAAGSSGGTGGGSGGGSGADAAAMAVAVSLSRRSSALREADNSLLRVSLVAADLATLLWRFSAQLSFSEEARGGGRASNARLLFALLQLGRYYVVEAPTSELRQAQKLLAAAGGAAAALGLEAAAAVVVPGAGAGGGGNSAAVSSTAAAACSADDLSKLSSHAPFVLALSLLCMGPAEWMAARRSMLVLAARAGAARAQQQQGAGGDSTGGSSHRRSSSGASPAAAAAAAAAAGAAAASSAALSDEALYTAAVPMLRLFGFVDWLHQWAKPAVGSGSGGSSGSGGWGGAMAQQLADLAGCAQAAGELLEVADEAEEAFGLQDLLDGFGCLGVALGPKSATVEEFLRVACT